MSFAHLFDDFDFSPAIFLKNSGDITDFNGFKQFVLDTDLNDYFGEKYELGYSENLVNLQFLVSAFTYFYFFNEFYLNNEQFQNNKDFINKYLSKKFSNFDTLNNYLNERNVSKKWVKIIEKSYAKEDDLDKIICLSFVKNTFVHEYLAHQKWFYDQIQKVN